MQDTVANVLIIVFVIVPLVLLVWFLMNAMGVAWRLQTLVLSLPF
jgi:hypothetical protein